MTLFYHTEAPQYKRYLETHARPFPQQLKADSLVPYSQETREGKPLTLASGEAVQRTRFHYLEEKTPGGKTVTYKYLETLIPGTGSCFFLSAGLDYKTAIDAVINHLGSDPELEAMIINDMVVAFTTQALCTRFESFDRTVFETQIHAYREAKTEGKFEKAQDIANEYCSQKERIIHYLETCKQELGRNNSLWYVLLPGKGEHLLMNAVAKVFNLKFQLYQRMEDRQQKTSNGCVMDRIICCHSYPHDLPNFEDKEIIHIIYEKDHFNLMTRNHPTYKEECLEAYIQEKIFLEFQYDNDKMEELKEEVCIRKEEEWNAEENTEFHTTLQDWSLEDEELVIDRTTYTETDYARYVHGSLYPPNVETERDKQALKNEIIYFYKSKNLPNVESAHAAVNSKNIQPIAISYTSSLSKSAGKRKQRPDEFSSLAISKRKKYEFTLEEMSYQMSLVKLFLVQGYDTSPYLRIKTIEHLLNNLCEIYILPLKKPSNLDEKNPDYIENIKNQNKISTEKRRLHFYALIHKGNFVLRYPNPDNAEQLKELKDACNNLKEAHSKSTSKNYTTASYLTLLRLLLSIGKENYSTDDYDDQIKKCLEKISSPSSFKKPTGSAQPESDKTLRTLLSRPLYIFEGQNAYMKHALLGLCGQVERLTFSEKANKETSFSKNKTAHHPQGNSSQPVEDLFTPTMLEELKAYWERQAGKEKTLPAIKTQNIAPLKAKKNAQKTLEPTIVALKTIDEIIKKSKKTAPLISSTLATNDNKSLDEIAINNKVIEEESEDELIFSSDEEKSFLGNINQAKGNLKTEIPTFQSETNFLNQEKIQVIAASETIPAENNSTLDFPDNQNRQEKSSEVDSQIMNPRKDEEQFLRTLDSYFNSRPSHVLKFHLTNSNNKKSATLLNIACRKNYFEGAKIIIDLMIKYIGPHTGLFQDLINHEDSGRFSPLNSAASWDAFDIANLLIETQIHKCKLKINSPTFQKFICHRDKDSMTPLHAATKRGAFNLTQLLINTQKQGLELGSKEFLDFINSPDHLGFTPWFSAVINFNSELVDFFLETYVEAFGIDSSQFEAILNHCNHAKYTSLTSIVKNNEVRNARHLVGKIEKKFDKNKEIFKNFLTHTDNHGLTPLSHALIENHLELAEFLLDKTQHVFDDDKNTLINYLNKALHTVCMMAHLDGAKLLINKFKERWTLQSIEFKTLLNLKDHDFNPFQAAAKSGAITFLDFLITTSKEAYSKDKTGLKNYLTSKNELGFTALNTAANEDSFEAVKLIFSELQNLLTPMEKIDYILEPNKPNAKGQFSSAIDNAAKKISSDIFKYLLKRIRENLSEGQLIPLLQEKKYLSKNGHFRLSWLQEAIYARCYENSYLILREMKKECRYPATFQNYINYCLHRMRLSKDQSRAKNDFNDFLNRKDLFTNNKIFEEEGKFENLGPESKTPAPPSAPEHRWQNTPPQQLPSSTPDASHRNGPASDLDFLENLAGYRPNQGYRSNNIYSSRDVGRNNNPNKHPGRPYQPSRS